MTILELKATLSALPVSERAEPAQYLLHTLEPVHSGGPSSDGDDGRVAGGSLDRGATTRSWFRPVPIALVDEGKTVMSRWEDVEARILARLRRMSLAQTTPVYPQSDQLGSVTSPLPIFGLLPRNLIGSGSPHQSSKSSAEADLDEAAERGIVDNGPDSAAVWWLACASGLERIASAPESSPVVEGDVAASARSSSPTRNFLPSPNRSDRNDRDHSRPTRSGTRFRTLPMRVHKLGGPPDDGPHVCGSDRRGDPATPAAEQAIALPGNSKQRPTRHAARTHRTLRDGRLESRATFPPNASRPPCTSRSPRGKKGDPARTCTWPPATATLSQPSAPRPHHLNAPTSPHRVRTRRLPQRRHLGDRWLAQSAGRPHRP